MTAILCWNIQYGRGVDGAVDISRIAETAKAMADADVLCFQEVANFDPSLEPAHRANQAAALATAFPDHEAFFGAACDRLGDDGRRWSFGNLILSRLPVLEVFHHLLPRPADAHVRHMQRQAIEAVVAAPGGTMRVMTTHLEYYSARQRSAQVERLRALHAEACTQRPPGPGDSSAGPYAIAPRPSSLVLCGDLNLTPESPEYTRLTAPFETATPPLSDAWAHAGTGAPPRATCGVHDRETWSEGPHCRDFFFVTGDIAARIEAVTVDAETMASDHQPIMLRLDFA
ncbi:MAG: endonuclease/exonuclease/phosphatase family protein [Rhodospirillales bacterium]|jgi:endonuclease/exonuclease/phosphatase family metal-dependent hydrolase|nr:endonuclease/exonuclease/phosphatase family protein [Rhodospirillales bacterium]